MQRKATTTAKLRVTKTKVTKTKRSLEERGHAIGFRGACAAVLVVAAMFCLWRSREAFEYLSRTPEGRFRVLRESVAALFYANQKGALPAGSATGDAQQDAYFSRDPSSNSNAQTPALGVVATESAAGNAYFLCQRLPTFRCQCRCLSIKRQRQSTWNERRFPKA